jgi:hypothetical protein
MIRKNTHRLTVCLIASLATAAALAAAAAAGTAAGAVDPGQTARGQALNQLYGSGATTMSADQFRATYLRSVALNKRYQLGDFAQPVASTQPSDTSTQANQTRGEWLNAQYGNAATRMSPDEFHALYLRSDALNKQYHLGNYAQPPATTTPTTTGNGFEWTTAGIATAATLGALLLAISIAISRHLHWHLPTAHSH